MPDQKAHPFVVTFCFLFDKGNLLVIERNNQPYKGTITIPGGHKLTGETLQDACRREMAEESGCLVGSLEFVGIVYAHAQAPEQAEYLCAYYVAHSHTGCACSGSEGQVRWVPVDEILQAGPETPYHPALLELLPLVASKKYPFEGMMHHRPDGSYYYTAKAAR